jgi:hypothetical protein
MYVLGGFVAGAQSASVIKFDTEANDSTQGTWSEMTPMPGMYFGFAACAVMKNILVFGGIQEIVFDGVTTVSKFDTEANEWSTLA